MINLTKEKIIELISKHRKELEQKFDVKNLYLFGSYARDEQTSKSDIDFIVEYNKTSIRNQSKNIELALFLEDIFNREVEVGRFEDLSNLVVEHVESTMVKC